jgi:hypothetical protein
MKMRKFYLSFFMALLLGCASEPAPGPTPPPVEEVPASVPVPEPAAPVKETVFDPGSISKEVFDSTKVDVQNFIQDLNRIISRKDYKVWVEHLGEEYFTEISSPSFLSETSNQPRLKTQKIVLNSAEDYFNYVVVPSRADDRVDDIEFVSQNRVKAYRVTPSGQRLRLYELEGFGDTWKIIN